MIKRKRMRLPFLVAMVVVAAMTAGNAGSEGAGTTNATGVYTTFRAVLNGVEVTNVTLPGIPTTLPFKAKPGGNLPKPCGAGGTSVSSSQANQLCMGAPSKDYFFQWWMGVHHQKGQTMYSFSQWYEWTGNGSTVTYFDSVCFDTGGYWHYYGCSDWNTRIGSNAVRSHAEWKYQCCGGSTYGAQKRPSSDVTATADGTIYGTVRDG